MAGVTRFTAIQAGNKYSSIDFLILPFYLPLVRDLALMCQG